MPARAALLARVAAWDRLRPQVRSAWASLLASCAPSLHDRSSIRSHSAQASQDRHTQTYKTPAQVLSQEFRGRTVTFHVKGSCSQGFEHHSKHVEEHISTDCDTTFTGSGASSGKAESSNRVTLALLAAKQKAIGVAHAVLLPAGYPGSVGPGYWGFVLGQSVANLAISINTVVASTFMLYAVGLGAGAVPTAGALNWVLKDGLGQLGTLAFGKAVSHGLDIHSKSWYFLSYAILSAACLVEVLTILVPQYFLLLGSVANGLKGLAWMANSATRSVFNLSFCRDTNIADLTAKSTSQYICATMFGTVLGASLCSVLGQDALAALCVYSALTGITVAAAYTTVTYIPLPTLNNTRLQLLCESFLAAIDAAAAAKHMQRLTQLAPAQRAASVAAAAAAGGAASAAGSTTCAVNLETSASAWADAATGVCEAGGEDTAAAADAAARQAKVKPGSIAWGTIGQEHTYDEDTAPEVPSPEQLAPNDPPLPFIMGDQRLLDPAVIVGESLERVLEDTGPELVVMLLSTYRLGHAVVLPRGPAVHVLLHQEASNRDILQAFLQACLLRRRMRAGVPLGMAVCKHATEWQQHLDAKRVRQQQEKREREQWQREQAQQQQQDKQTVCHTGCGTATEPKSTGSTSSSSTSQSDMASSQQPSLSASQSAAPAGQLEPQLAGGTAWEELGREELQGQCTVQGTSSLALTELRIVLQDTLHTAERLTSPFTRSLLAAGWQLDKVVVEAEKRRVRW